MDHLMRWFCRRADAVETQRQIHEIERQMSETTEHVANKLADVGRQLSEHDARLDLIQRRARIRYRDYDHHPDFHGDRSTGDGGHAAGGVG
jgi:CRISPR/Cas system CMR-associated protein Cmr5 small subunit